MTKAAAIHQPLSLDRLMAHFEHAYSEQGRVRKNVKKGRVLLYTSLIQSLLLTNVALSLLRYAPDSPDIL